MDDAMPRMIWADLFIIDQYYTMEATIIHLFNSSIIGLDVNKRVSSGKYKWQTNIIYLFIKDWLYKVRVGISFCPTEDMILNHYKNMLQRIQLIHIPSLIINCLVDLLSSIIPINIPSPSLIKVNISPSAQECVETNGKTAKTKHPGKGLKSKPTE